MRSKVEDKMHKRNQTQALSTNLNLLNQVLSKSFVWKFPTSPENVTRHPYSRILRSPALDRVKFSTFPSFPLSVMARPETRLPSSSDP
ncbi:hypothetical protein PanWU01x14_106070 [Parasponia andersonii]|uniref:Uncharacterized protein n=1 Tax=Parasponia andersonii TaxID=3476 RepID=A0A2P5D1B9_PARAD|nr:hypothetical protein PanWU01x14_106070 [Parasponia andersonii]